MKNLNNNIFKVLVLVMMAFPSQKAFSTVYTTIMDGNWNAANIWSPSKPVPNYGFIDTIIINHNIDLNTSANIFGYFVVNQGASLINSSKYITVKAGSIIINNGSIGVNSFLVDWGQTSVTNNGIITTATSLLNKEGEFINNGIMNIGSFIKNEGNGVITNAVGSDFILGTYFFNQGSIFINNGNLEVGSYMKNQSLGVFTNGANSTFKVVTNFYNYSTFTNEGQISVLGNFTNDWNTTFSNQGIINTYGNYTNRGSFANSGTLNIQGAALNDWNSSITNSGTITSVSNFDNKSYIQNTNTLNFLADLSSDWGTSVDNYGTINVLNDLVNKGTIVNDGAFIVDGLANSTNGTIDGDGSICNSDGVTDPTAGSKAGVYCAICVGEGSTLPVSLIEFNAIAYDGKIQISWATASEVNNNYFEVLKSIDGTNFEVISKVEGQGNSNMLKSYSIEDFKVNSGMIYYKLRQVDFDGKSTIFNIISVEYIGGFEAKLFPNPVNKGNEIDIESTEDGEMLIGIYNIAGQLVSEYNSSESRMNISTEQLETGMYLIRIFQNNNVISKKLQIN